MGTPERLKKFSISLTVLHEISHSAYSLLSCHLIEGMMM